MRPPARRNAPSGDPREAPPDHGSRSRFTRHQASARTTSRPEEEQLLRLVEHIPAIVYVEMDDDQATTYVSPRIEDVLGYSSKRFVEDPGFWTEIIHPDDLEPAIAANRRADESHNVFLSEYRLRTAEGDYRWFRDEAIYVEEDGLGYWQGVMVDVTEQKRAEEQAREAAKRFQTLVEQIPAITYIDPLEREPVESLYVSPQIEAVLGFPAEQALHDPNWWVDLIHPEDRSRALEISNRADETGEPYQGEYRLMTADGREVWVRDQSILVRHEDATPQYWQGVMFDISAMKRAELEMQRALQLERNAAEELREADGIKNTFLQAVSHDLRSPLTAMLGNAVTLEKEDELGLSHETRRALIDSLVQQTRKLSGIVADLLDLERLTRGMIEPRRANTKVGELVARVIAESDSLRDRSVHIEVEPAPTDVDRTMVERIVENLLGNAAKHTAAHSNIWVRVQAQLGGVLIAVEDDGSGVPDELREALFAAFERGPSANPPAPGVGLGLSIVARFALLHGGRAWIEEREGGGASFQVFLPHPSDSDTSAERPAEAS